MREIKFRGICKNTGKFVYGGYAEKAITAHSVVASTAIIPSGCYAVDVIPESVGQSTGYKYLDTGEEMYTGDISYVSGTGNCVVEINPYWGIMLKKGAIEQPLLDCIREDDHPVKLGNIHENKELLS